MKLLMISGDRLLAAGKQGAFYSTLEELSKHFERIDVICPKVEGAPIDRIFETVYIHPSPYGLSRQASWICKKGEGLFAQHKHEVMTAHDYPPFYNAQGAAHLSRTLGIPYISEIHHIVGRPTVSSFTEFIGKWMSHFMVKSITKPAKKIRTVNQEVKEYLIKRGVDSRKISVVPSFYIDTKIFRPDISSKKYDVITVARLVDNKGLFELLDAIQSLQGKTLAIVGDGPLRKKLESNIQAFHIGDRVTLLGWLPSPSDIADALRSSRVFVMNSKSEGGPRSSLEALACGIPVIATKVGIMPDIIKDQQNGLFVDGSAKDLSEKISIVFNDESARSAMAQSAPSSVSQFEKQHAVKAYADFIKSCA